MIAKNDIVPHSTLLFETLLKRQIKNNDKKFNFGTDFREKMLKIF